MPRKKSDAPAETPAWTPRTLRWVGDGRGSVPGYPMADLRPRDQREEEALLGTRLWVLPPDPEPAAG